MTVRDVRVSGTSGTAEFDTGVPDGQKQRQKIPLVNSEAGWTLCGGGSPGSTTG
jgi:hypothetical protein